MVIDHVLIYHFLASCHEKYKLNLRFPKVIKKLRQEMKHKIIRKKIINEFNQIRCKLFLYVSSNYTWHKSLKFAWMQAFDWKLDIYRVSHFEMDFMNWLWWIKICKLDLVWRWFWNAEIGNFWVPQLFSKKVTSVGLNSLQQKGYQISVKNWIFDDPFHEKGSVLVILVPGII